MSVKFLEQLAIFEMVPLSILKEPSKILDVEPRNSTTVVFDLPISENVYVEFNEYYFWQSKPNPLSGIL